MPESHTISINRDMLLPKYDYQGISVNRPSSCQIARGMLFDHEDVSVSDTEKPTVFGLVG